MRGLAKTSRGHASMELIDRPKPEPAADEAFETFLAGGTAKPVFDVSELRE